MFKKLNKKGFTLAELLIVVAIIGVLVAISIPIFTNQLKKAHLATNQANARAAYAAVVADLLDKEKDSGTETYDVKKATIDSSSTTGTPVTGAPATWTVSGNTNLTDTTKSKWTITISSSGEPTFAFVS